MTRHRKNCDGPFYVAAEECMSCGAPEFEAGSLMSHDDAGHCFFVQQPTTSGQLNSAIRAVWASCCGAVRYGGDDPSILTRLARLGELNRCDRRPSQQVPIAIRDHARFEYQNPACESSATSCIELIMRSLSGSMMLKYSGSRASDFHQAVTGGSFLFNFGSPEVPHMIRIHLNHDSGNQWLLRLSENETARIGIAMLIDKALQHDRSFQGIQWLTENQAADASSVGEPHPY